MDTIEHTTTLTTLECCKCGMAMGLSRRWVDRARDIGNFTQQFWCPYCGHQQGWGVSQHAKEISRLKAERDQAQNNAVWHKQRKDAAQAEAEHFRRSRDGTRGVLSKIKKRVARGVCPCCNRHFENLHRHMTSKHPEVANGNAEQPTEAAK